MTTMLTIGFRRVLSVVLLPALLACNGADPVVRAMRTTMMGDGHVNRYTIAISVTNRGNMKQASNVLQFVDIFEGDAKRDTRSIRPLAPGQTFNTTYIYKRSADAGPGTTTLTLRLNMRQPAAPGAADCNTGNDSATVTF
jgi:hypothetical protein